MNAKKLAALGAACVLAATPALAAEWLEVDSQPTLVQEPTQTVVPAEGLAEDEVHASSSAPETPSDKGEKASDSQS